MQTKDSNKSKTLEKNFSAVRLSIQEACNENQRSLSEVQLLAASKRTDANGVLLAYKMGHRLFGENRAQSLRDKYDALKDICPEIEWHFIGHLQKNKVKYIVGRATTLQSLDSLDLAQALQNKIKRTPNTPVLRVMIQVKMGEEQSKTGIPESEVLTFCHQIHSDFPELKLCGLMMIPPLQRDPPYWFQRLHDIALQGRKQGLPLQELSMGMSGDLQHAIAAGSTMIRVGTALFRDI